MTIYLTAPSLISGFQFLVDKKPYTAVVSDIFPADLNGDGIQEAIFLGRQTQPATIPTWSNSTVHIFQINDRGAWVETTSSLLPDNVIEGTEPALVFGDFNNDGKVDFFVPGCTDMNYLVPSYLFTNTGSSFTKQAFDFQTWAHGAYAADVNQDGYLDVLSTDYGPRAGIGFGGPSGFVYKATFGRGLWSSSGICAGDFLGDGSVSILVSDKEGGVNSTALFKWNLDSVGNLTFSNLATLPTPRFHLAKWDANQFAGNGQEKSHDIRIVPFDFSGDGLMDAIEISRPWFTNGTWPEYSEIQFLLNKGNGVFEDVTDSKLVGYNTASNASYQPIFLDVNLDGRTDIFIGSPDFFANYNSTAVLLQQPNGTFIEAGRDAFSNLWQSAVTSVRSANLGYVIADWGQSMQLAKGLNGKISVLGSVCYQTQGGMSNMVFSSDLSFGNVSLNESITGSAGNDTLDGGAGTDTVVFSGDRASYTVSKTSTGWTVSSTAQGVYTLTNVERLKFGNLSVATDLGSDQSAGQTALLLGAVSGKQAMLANQSLLGTVINFIDAGYSMQQLSGALMRLDIWGLLANGGAASATNRQIANYLLSTVNATAPDNATLTEAVGALDAESGASQGNFLWQLAASSANQIQVGLVGLSATGLEFTS